MAESPFIKAVHLVAAVFNKHIVLNTSLDKTDKSNNGFVDIDVSAGGTIVVTATQFEENFVLRLITNPGGAFTLEVPDGGRVFAVDNTTTQTCTVDTTTGGSTVSVPTVTTKIMYSKGTDLVELAA